MVQRYKGEGKEISYNNRTGIDISSLKHIKVIVNALKNRVNESHKNIRQSWVSVKVFFSMSWHTGHELNFFTRANTFKLKEG